MPKLESIPAGWEVGNSTPENGSPGTAGRDDAAICSPLPQENCGCQSIRGNSVQRQSPRHARIVGSDIVVFCEGLANVRLKRNL